MAIFKNTLYSNFFLRFGDRTISFKNNFYTDDEKLIEFLTSRSDFVRLDESVVSFLEKEESEKVEVETSNDNSSTSAEIADANLNEIDGVITSFLDKEENDLIIKKKKKNEEVTDVKIV